ncbi:OmpW/AlkL family protein [Parasphingorhabdus sp.]|uniref:OmpW/AlkL family protein n=1 Tax=Parasphingorhabdus sp. TaxID=2709688 RepID=UPI003D2E1967
MKNGIFKGAAIFATAAMLPTAAYAEAGTIQAKLLGTLVAPDASITEVKVDNIGLPAGSDTAANDNFIPTIAIEYFVTDNISLETIAGLTQHDVDGTGGIGGLETVSDAKILPATLTIKYHFGDMDGFKPYIGAGPSYFVFIDEQPGTALVGFGADRLQLNDKFGVALQAGFDLPLNDSGLGLSVDAKRYFLRTDASWTDANGAELLRTRHKIDPWVISAGLAFRF